MCTSIPCADNWFFQRTPPRAATPFANRSSSQRCRPPIFFTPSPTTMFLEVDATQHYTRESLHIHRRRAFTCRCPSIGSRSQIILTYPASHHPKSQRRHRFHSPCPRGLHLESCPLHPKSCPRGGMKMMPALGFWVAAIRDSLV